MKIKRGEINAPWGGIYSLAKKREELTGEEFNGEIIGNLTSLVDENSELQCMLSRCLK